MGGQTRTIGTPAKFGGARSARALDIIDRLARAGQHSMRMALATASVRTPGGHRLQIPAHVSFPKYRRFPEAASQSARLASSMNGRHRMTAMFDGGGHLQREIQDLAPAM